MDPTADAEADAIALAVLEEFKRLPAKRKPAVRGNGLREWVPLAGIVVKGPDSLKCVALATGMKCLPACKLPLANGVALHDWHAEVLAIRAFNRFVLDECRRLAQDGAAQSDYLRRRTQAEVSGLSPDDSCSWHGQPFAWREELTLHMYCSEAPCGDASMELVMASQEDATPWTIPPSPAPSPVPAAIAASSSTPTPTTATTPSPNPAFTTTTDDAAAPNAPQLLLLAGRGYFSRLGVVRRKPARGDAPPTASKSCSDKLALRQCASLLSSLASLFVSPKGAYLATLVLPASQYSAAGCGRCFSAGESGGVSADGEEGWVGGAGNAGETAEGDDAKAPAGRMRPVAGRQWEGTGYAFVPFRVETTAREFEFSRRAILPSGGGPGEEDKARKVAASNLAVAWTRDGAVEEGLIGGALQGRKAFDTKGASLTSRRRMWESAVEVAAALGDERISMELAKRTYDEVKEGVLLRGRRRVKEEVRTKALKGWLRSTGDGGFSL